MIFSGPAMSRALKAHLHSLSSQVSVWSSQATCPMLTLILGYQEVKSSTLSYVLLMMFIIAFLSQVWRLMCKMKLTKVLLKFNFW